MLPQCCYNVAERWGRLTESSSQFNNLQRLLPCVFLIHFRFSSFLIGSLLKLPAKQNQLKIVWKCISSASFFTSVLHSSSSLQFFTPVLHFLRIFASSTFNAPLGCLRCLRTPVSTPAMNSFECLDTAKHRSLNGPHQVADSLKKLFRSFGGIPSRLL